MPKKPPESVSDAAIATRDRLLRALTVMRGVDARRCRRAVHAIHDIIADLERGVRIAPCECPDVVQRNPTTEIERKVMAFWRATDYLQHWSFSGNPAITAADLCRAFDAIVIG